MNINETGGSVPRIGIGSGREPSVPAHVSAAAPESFARIYQLAGARSNSAKLPDEIPTDVWAEVQRASSLADDLAARGQQVRFDTHRLSGRVVASLCDADGEQLRALALAELVPSPRSASASNPNWAA